MGLLFVSVTVTRRRFRRSTRAVRVGPKEAPRCAGQLPLPIEWRAFCEIGGGGSESALASCVDMIACRELGAPDM